MIKAEWEAERERMTEDPEWNAMRHQALRDAAAEQKMKEFFAEAGLDTDGNVHKHPCPECTQKFDNERALELHGKYTHAPKEVDPTADLIREALANAGVEMSGEIRTTEPIRLCPLTTHKPLSVGNLNGKDQYDQEGYRKVRVTFDTGAGESVSPP